MEVGTYLFHRHMHTPHEQNQTNKSMSPCAYLAQHTATRKPVPKLEQPLIKHLLSPVQFTIREPPKTRISFSLLPKTKATKATRDDHRQIVPAEEETCMPYGLFDATIDAPTTTARDGSQGVLVNFNINHHLYPHDNDIIYSPSSTQKHRVKYKTKIYHTNIKTKPECYVSPIPQYSPAMHLVDYHQPPNHPTQNTISPNLTKTPILTTKKIKKISHQSQNGVHSSLKPNKGTQRSVISFPIYTQ